MKEYECFEYSDLVEEIRILIEINHICIAKVARINAMDILQLVKDNSTLINEKLKEDNEKLNIKMINIENATKGYFKKIEEVLDAK